MRPQDLRIRSGIWVLLLATSVVTAQGAALDLAGAWRFRLDSEDQGVAQQWWTARLPDTIELPGMLTAQGYGDPVSMQTQWTGNVREEWFQDPYYKQYQEPNNFKIPFWLQPERHYVGAAWYQRDITLPDTWRGKRISLLLERPHWETTVWLDDRRVGACNSLGTAHVHVLGHDLTPGQHRLTIRVDNRMIVDVGPNSHSVSDHTQGNWNGIAGRLELQATDIVWIEDVQVYPQLADHAIDVKVNVRGLAAQPDNFRLEARISSRDRKETYPAMQVVSMRDRRDEIISLRYHLGESCRMWDEFTPVLYDLEVVLQAGQVLQRKTVTFGMRAMGKQGTQITLNGQPIFLRGTLDCCIFPLTGHPPTEVDYWKRMIRVCKAHGLNHMRFHSWCPPEAAFVAADELGFYYQVECSSWANQGATIGDGRPLDKWIYAEAEAMLKAYGNHPSFILMAYGNEPGGSQQNSFLGEFVTHWRTQDPRRLYTSAAGWPLIPENDFHNAPGPRIQQWGQGLASIINGQPPRSDYDWSSFVQRYPQTPVVSHEIGQWCVYPNLAEREKYTGLLKAKNFDVFAEQLERHHMLDQAHSFLMASGKLQALCYKADIEAALRTPDFGGFQLLDLHDFPGQGTALVGVLDPFWDSKGYVTAEEFHRFCAPVVPLARLKQHIFTNGDLLDAPVDMAQFGPRDLQDAQVAWRLRDAVGEIWKQGRLPAQTIPRGGLSNVGQLEVPLRGFDQATQLTLELAIPGTAIHNHWDLWVYPEVQPEPRTDILVARTWDESVVQRLQQGGKVLLSPPAQIIRNDEDKPIRMGFSSIFWNTVWTARQAPHTLGILCDPVHPALAQFPTEYHSNWQWWELIHGATPFIVTEHAELKPLVQVIDDWVTARKLALIFEARVGRGKLIMAACDLIAALDQRPVARQMRQSLLSYMASDRFQPGQRFTPEQVKALMREPSTLAKLGATIKASNHQPAYGPELVLDQDPSSIWHTAWAPMAPYPHSLVLDLKQERNLRALTCLPRQDMDNGRIARYEIYVSSDGKAWDAPVAQGQWPNSPEQQTVTFSQTQRARFVKLHALSEVKGRSFASLAEFDVVLAPKDEADGPTETASRRNTVNVESMLSNWLAQDKNGDGKLAQDEVTGLMRQYFEGNDTNQDGFLVRSELVALARRLRNNQNRQRRQTWMSTEDVLARAPAGVTVIPDIAYRTGNEAWKLDLAMPSDKDGPLRPALVFVHGGGWRNGDKRAPAFLNPTLEFAAKGYVCVTVNYRLLGNAQGIDDCIADVKCAVRWLRAHAAEYNVDPTCFGAYGNSAGAHLVSLLGLCPRSAGMEGDGPYQAYSSMVQAVVASATPASFMIPMSERARARQSAFAMSEELRKKISPIAYVNPDAPPFLLFHEVSDSTVGVYQSDRLFEALKAAGAKEILYERYEDGSGHGAFMKNIEETGPIRAAFFERVLKKGS